MCIHSKIDKLYKEYSEDEIEKAIEIAVDILKKEKKQSLLDKIASKLYFFRKDKDELKHYVIESQLSKARLEFNTHILEHKKDRALMKELANKVIANEEKRIMNYYINEATPIMSWAKRKDGTYIDLNKATSKMLFDNIPIDDIIGRNDIDIATEILKKYPNRTFGEICKGTDSITLKNNRAMKFFEWGTIYDKFEYMVVYKNLILDHEENVIGVVGSAIIVTEEVNTLLNIMNNTTDDKTKDEIRSYLKKYGFGCENKFTKDNIFEYDM